VQNKFNITNILKLNDFILVTSQYKEKLLSNFIINFFLLH